MYKGPPRSTGRVSPGPAPTATAGGAPHGARCRTGQKCRPRRRLWDADPLHLGAWERQGRRTPGVPPPKGLTTTVPPTPPTARPLHAVGAGSANSRRPHAGGLSRRPCPQRLSWLGHWSRPHHGATQPGGRGWYREKREREKTRHAAGCPYDCGSLGLCTKGTATPGCPQGVPQGCAGGGGAAQCPKPPPSQGSASKGGTVGSSGSSSASPERSGTQRPRPLKCGSPQAEWNT